jgi:hypothetical protein
LRLLHEIPGAFVIPNPWGIGSARFLAGLGYFERCIRRRDWAKKWQADAKRGAGPRVSYRRCDGFDCLGGPGKGLWRCAGGGGGNDRACGRFEIGGMHDRGFDRKLRNPTLRYSSGCGEDRGSRASGTSASISICPDSANTQFPLSQSEPGRHHQSPSSLRKSWRRCALRPRFARPCCGRSSLCGGLEARRFHGGNQRKVISVAELVAAGVKRISLSTSP